MTHRSTNTRRRFLPTLLLALVLAVAPLSSLLLMADAAVAASSSHHTATMPPCPMHGEAGSNTSDAAQEISPADLSSEASVSPNCYCSLICHAMIDLPALFVVAGRAGKPVHSAQRASAAHVFEPAPMPRPPRH